MPSLFQVWYAFIGDEKTMDKLKGIEVIGMALNEIRSNGTMIEHKRETAGEMYEKVRKIWNFIITDDSERV